MEFHDEPPARAESLGDCIRSLLVHDDQRGCYLRLYATVTDVVADDPYLMSKEMEAGASPVLIDRDVSSVIVPLPKKVFLPGEKAESISQGIFRGNVRQLAGQPDRVGKKAALALEKLAKAIDVGDTITRTYIATGGTYKTCLFALRPHPLHLEWVQSE